jgi:N12 class adenine-specific DNA methylase
MGKGRLCPPAEKIADISVFGTQITRSGFNYRSVHIKPERGIFSMIEDQLVNLCHRPSSGDTFLSTANCMFAAVLSC